MRRFVDISPCSYRSVSQFSHERGKRAIITPSRLAARALGAPSQTLESLAISCLQQAGWAIASTLKAQAIFRQVLQETVQSTDPRGTAKAWLPTVRVLLQSSPDLSPVLSSVLSTGANRTHHLLQVAQAFQQALHEDKLVDLSELYWRAIAYSPPPQPLLIYGYFQPRQDELMWINRIAAADSIVYLPGADTALFKDVWGSINWLVEQNWEIVTTENPEAGAIGESLSQVFISDSSQISPKTSLPLEATTQQSGCALAHGYSTFEDEIRGTLAQVKALLNAETPASEIAIIARDEVAYGPKLIDISWEYGVPLRALYDTPLLTTRLGAWLTLLIEVMDTDWPFEATAKLLSHPLGSNPDQNFWATVRAQHPVGFNDWQAIAQELLQLDLSLLHKRHHPERRDSWVAWWKRLFRTFNLRQRCARWARESLAFNKLEQGLVELSKPEAEKLKGPDFQQEFRDLLETLTVPAQPGRGGVELHKPTSVVGAQYRHLFVVGMAEGVLPAAISNDPVLDFYGRQQLQHQGLPLPTAAELARREALSFYALLQTARGKVTFSYAQLKGRQEQLPSPYLNQLGLQTVEPPTISTSSPEELRRLSLRHSEDHGDTVLSHARHAFTVEQHRESSAAPDEYDGVIGVPLDYSAWVFSASQLRNLGQCPFKWFADKLLKLGPPNEVEEDLNPGQIGQLYHKVLELVLAEKQQRPEVEITDAQLLAEKFAIAEREIIPANLPPWALRRREHLRCLALALADPEFLPEGNQPLVLEATFNGEWQGLKVRGQIDRIDRTDNGLVLIDYKTGQSRPPGIKDRNGKACIDVQLPLYQEAAGPDLFPDQPVATAYYYSIRGRKQISTSSTAPQQELPAALDRCKAHLNQGHYPVQPDKGRRPVPTAILMPCVARENASATRRLAVGLTKQQEQAAYASHSVAVTAGAGTGKTHMLSERYLHFLRQGVSPLQMVAVTFTEKAATELRSRIRQTIAQQMSLHDQSPQENRPDLLAELEAAPISTFHALAARICREHPDQATVPPDFAIQDQFDGPIWLAETLGAALTQLPSPLYETVPFSVMRAVLPALLADPLTAKEALQRDLADWLPILEQMRQQALEDLLASEAWQTGHRVLNAHAAPGDKLDAYRLEALGAIAQLEQGHDLAIALGVLSGLKVNVGSQKNWGGKDVLTAVKEAIKALRTLAEDACKAGLITLTPNPFDDETEAMLPAMRAAFAWTWDYLRKAKYEQRCLDFNDLEVHALQALDDPTVQNYYAQRWQVFLIDEFQDTNPIQGQLLEKLTATATLTIVGDVKQSIYGFRRADVRVFQDWQARIHPKGDPVELSLSFRTHGSLIHQINRVFAPVLADLHQPLEAHRNEPLQPTPEIQLYVVTVDEDYKDDKAIDTNTESCRWVEAQKIAALVEEMLRAPIQVQDKPSGELRPIQPGDIAILSRTWGPLEFYGNAISARDIPILQAGGGNLLATREAKDAWTMLRFLADPTDDLALAAVLRSPFFAISDRALYPLAQSLPEKTSWWKHLQTAEDPALTRAYTVLKELLVARRTEAPTRLLQLSDRLTGYTAVIANLPGANRRLADWTGFLELVRSLEHGSFDVLAVVRRLKRLQSGEVKIPRPALAGGAAVSLMTIHGAKGLEWPVVIVPDLANRGSTDSPLTRFDPALGVAFKLEDDAGDRQKSALYTLLEQRQKADDREESKRVLYVALTRARDRLILTAAAASGGSLDILQPGFTGWMQPQAIAFDPALAKPVQPIAPALLQRPVQVLTHVAGSGFSDLPVTALSDYALCPKRFEFRYGEGHPGYREGDGSGESAMAIGKLAHKALELKIRDFDTLKRYVSDLTDQQVQDALDCAERFYHAEEFSPYRQEPLQWEVPVSLTLNGITFNGFVDLMGEDFVLDFKTDRTIHPEHHQFQLWAYSKATAKPNAHIAYLRRDRLHTFNSAKLSELESSALVLVNGLAQGDFTPTPAEASCRICPYAEVCDR